MMCIVPFVIVRLSPVLIIHPQVISMRYKANFPRACIISCYLTGFVLMNLSLSAAKMRFSQIFEYSMHLITLAKERKEGKR